ncbi:MAG TPA: HAD-IIA family hydrolase [Armatimonadota bacterium]
MDFLTFVFDLDGVVYRGSQPVPGAAETIENLLRLGHQVYFFTNNSTKNRPSFVEKLAGMGITTDEAHFMTSSYATALYLQEQGAQGKTAYIVGEEGIRTELTAIGMKIVDDVTSEQVDYVVVGLDRHFTYQKITDAQQAIFHGAQFIATNADSTFPREGGMVTPGAGAMIAAITTASGTKPIVIAKPETPGLYELMKMAHTDAKHTVVVGDRLDTDIVVGNRVGAVSVLVLTGIATREDAERAPKERRPHIVVENLGQMLGALEKFGK